MFQLARGEPFGVDVRDFFEFERSLEGDRIAEAAADEEERVAIAVLLYDLGDAVVRPSTSSSSRAVLSYSVRSSGLRSRSASSLSLMLSASQVSPNSVTVGPTAAYHPPGTFIYRDSIRVTQKMSNQIAEEREQSADQDDHLDDVPDGAGCTEIWETLSERRAGD